MKLRAVGLCGVDDSVHPKQLVAYAHLYPFVEFGVLFRPDKEGQPRYPTGEWVRRLAEASESLGGTMKLAAHLCGTRVDEVLKGDDAFVARLPRWGFGRVQINATAVNGVDTSVFESGETGCDFLSGFLSVAEKHPGLEFILQKNDETEPLWGGVLAAFEDNKGAFPANVSMLLDESKGTGVLPKEGWPPIPPTTPCRVGYAGGIGPHNVGAVVDQIRAANEGSALALSFAEGVWIDMESSLRSNKDGRDVFDLDKCFRVMLEVCDDEARNELLTCPSPWNAGLG